MEEETEQNREGRKNKKTAKEHTLQSVLSQEKIGIIIIYTSLYVQHRLVSNMLQSYSSTYYDATDGNNCKPSFKHMAAYTKLGLSPESSNLAHLKFLTWSSSFSSLRRFLME